MGRNVVERIKGGCSVSGFMANQIWECGRAGALDDSQISDLGDLTVGPFTQAETSGWGSKVREESMMLAFADGPRWRHPVDRLDCV